MEIFCSISFATSFLIVAFFFSSFFSFHQVRWADLEEKKDADRKRAIGFVVGQTDWDKITDKSGHLAERALNRTKYI